MRGTSSADSKMHGTFSALQAQSRAWWQQNDVFEQVQGVRKMKEGQKVTTMCFIHMNDTAN
jgi:hypothetical protein